MTSSVGYLPPRHYLLCAAGAALILGGCTQEVFAKGENTIKFDRSAVPELQSGLEIPNKACFGSIQGSGSIRELSSLMPEGDRKKPEPQDAGWQPTELIDIAVRGDLYAVVDRRTPSVTVMNSKFARRWHWEQKGNGPGELQNPVAAQFDPRGGDTLWVLDNGRHKLLGFGPNGRFVRDVSVRSDVVSFDITTDGRFLLSHMVLAARARGKITVVSELSASGEDLPRLLLDTSAAKPPEFVLPGPNRPRIRVLDDVIALIYPPAGVITLYRQDAGQPLVRTQQILTCLTPELKQAYQKQLAERRNPQSSVDFISDVTRRGDTLFVIGARPDTLGRYGIQRFSLSKGVSFGSIVLPAGKRILPSEIRFRTSSTTALVVLDPGQGYVANLAISLTRK